MNKKFYITTAIDYVNGPPHIGHALEKIQADVLARYHRLLGQDVWFLIGTDENAQKNILAAEKANMPTFDFIDRNAAMFQNMAKLLNVSNNDFIRTSDEKKHWPGVVKLWKECEKSNDIYKKKYHGLYCIGCEAFITKKDLEDGLCPEHLKKPEKVSEENYFFRLSKYENQLRDLIKNDVLRIVPEKRKTEILNLINTGLEDFSVSRPAERMHGWGVPVPNDKSQRVYVWYDALSNYITALGYGTENTQSFGRYWPADIHVIGKGILRFHALYWPAMLMSAGLEVPKMLFVHDYITVNNRKMSKTIGNVINPIHLVDKYGSEPVRYFFLREISCFQDGDFSYKKFEERYEADLSKGLGNLVSRVLTMAEKTFGQQIIECNFGEIDAGFQQGINDVFKIAKKKIIEFKFNEVLSLIWTLISYCDQYIDKRRIWEQENHKELKGLLIVLAQIAVFISIFLPETSKKIFERLGVEDLFKFGIKNSWSFKIKKGESLFPRLD